MSRRPLKFRIFRNGLLIAAGRREILEGWVARLQTRFLGAVVPAAQLPTHSDEHLGSAVRMSQWPGRVKNFRTGVVVLSGTDFLP